VARPDPRQARLAPVTVLLDPGRGERFTQRLLAKDSAGSYGQGKRLESDPSDDSATGGAFYGRQSFCRWKS